MGVWGVVIFVLSVLHIVGDVLLWVVCVLVSVVHPVAILNTVFCVFCSLLMFVFDVCGDHMVEVTADMRLECCRHLHKLCLQNPFPQRWVPDSILW